MSVIAAIVVGAAIVTNVGIVAALLTAASIKYQQRQQEKLRDKLAKAADEAKGFQLATEGEVVNLPLVYGRARIGGNRVYHKVSSSYNYAAAAAGGVELLSSGDTNELNTISNSETVNSFNILLYYYATNYNRQTKAFEWNVSAGYYVDNPLASQSNSAYSGGGEHRLTAFPFTPVGPLTRSGPDSNIYNITLAAGLNTFAKVGARVKINHAPMLTYTAWLLQQDNEAIATSPATFNYKIQSYDNVTGATVLTADVDGASGTGAPSLNANVAGTKNEFLYVAQTICLAGIERIYSAFVNDKDHRHPDFGRSMRIHAYRDGNIADPLFVANDTLGNTSLFPEAAYSFQAFRLNRDDPQYGGAVPNVEFIIEGMRVFTINNVSEVYSLSGSKTYTNNPAYCLLDYLLSSKYGLGLSVADINLKSFWQAAQAYEVIVEVNGNTNIPLNGKLWEAKGSPRNLKRYECNLIIDTSKTVRENIVEILNTIPNSSFIWSDGQYKLIDRYPIEWVAGTYNPGTIVQYDTGTNIDLWRCLTTTTDVPTDASPNWERGPDENLVAAYITDDDIILQGDIGTAWPSLASRYNHCEISYINESDDFEQGTVDWPPIYSGTVYSTYLAEDNGIELHTTQDAVGATTEFHARAFAEEIVRKSRHRNTLRFTVGKALLYLEPGDLIHISSAELQIPYELYKIEELEVTDDNNIQLVLEKYDARILAWNAPDDEVVVPRNVYIGPIQQITGLTYTPASIFERLGSAGTLTWDPILLNNLQAYDVYYYPGSINEASTETAWIYAGSTTENKFRLPPLAYVESGSTYIATVVPRTVGGRIAPREDWAMGSFWPVIEFGVTAIPSLENAVIKLQIYVYAKTDRVGEVINDSGSYDFSIASFTPPVGFYASPAEALLGSGDVDNPGDLYFAESLTILDGGLTLAEPLSWSNLELFAPERNTIDITVYHRRLSAGAVPTVPTGGSYNFTTRAIVVPTGNVTWYTKENLPDGIGAVYETSATLSRMGNYGLNTNIPSWATPKLSNATGAQRITLRLYQWSSTAPPIAAGAESVYNWLDGSHGTPSNLGSWSFILLTNPGTAGVKLWVAERTLEAEATASTSLVDWDDGNTDVYTTDAGSVPGGKSKTVDIYHWALTIPSAPVQNSTYTWETDLLSNIPNSPQVWFDEPSVAPTPGFTLWKIEARLQEEISVATTTVFWSNYSIQAVGFAGDSGTAGGAGSSGASARRAYGVQLASYTPINVGVNFIATGDALPDSDLNQTGSPDFEWGGTWAWQQTANFTLLNGEAIFQSDGLFDATANQTVWQAPYLSTLKVGSLSAISTNTGSLSVTGDILVGSGGTITSQNVAFPIGAGDDGFGLNENGEFFVGDFTDNKFIYFDGADLTIKTPTLEILTGSALFSGDVGITSQTFGQSGIQLQDNGGAPRAYIGDGVNNFFKYTSTDGIQLGPDTQIEGANTISRKSPWYFSTDCTNFDGWTNNLSGTQGLLVEYATRAIVNNSWQYRLRTGFTGQYAFRRDVYQKGFFTGGIGIGEYNDWNLPRKFYCGIIMGRGWRNTNATIFLEIGFGNLYCGPFSSPGIVDGVSFVINFNVDNTTTQQIGKIVRSGVSTTTAQIFPGGLFNLTEYSLVDLFIDYDPVQGFCDFYVNDQVERILLTGANIPNQDDSQFKMGSISMYATDDVLVSDLVSVYVHKVGMWIKR